MKWSFIFLFSFSISSLIFAQPTISFQKCFGGSKDEGAAFISQTLDKGYILTGNTNSSNGDVSGCHGASPDAWVIEIDSNYNPLWQKCLGGTYYDGAIGSVKTNSGYAIGAFAGSLDGDINNNHGIVDYWFIKLDTARNIVWQKCFGGTDSESAYDFASTPDGGFLISGTALSFNGDVIGHHGSSGSNDLWIVKIDSSGNKVWVKCLGGSNGETWGYIDVDIAGNIYAVCSSYSRDGDVSCTGSTKYSWLVKLRPDGSTIWDKCFGGSSGTDEIHSLRVYNNKLLMSGRTSSNDYDLNHNYGNDDAWILLTDTSGNKIFSESFGGSSIEEFNDALLTDSGYIIAGGQTNSIDHDVTNNHQFGGGSDCWLLCTDTLGNLIWQNTYGSYGSDVISSMLISDNTLTLLATSVLGSMGGNSGDVFGSHGGGDFWLVKMDLMTAIENYEPSRNWLKIYPNPIVSEFSVQIAAQQNDYPLIYSLSDITGRTVLKPLQTSETMFKINSQDLLPGVYFLEVISKNGTIVRKIVKI